MLNQIRLLRAVLPHEFRAARTGPLYVAGAAALVIAGAPAAFSVRLEAGAGIALMRIATVLGVAGLAFLLDDPAAHSTEVNPVPRWMRHLARAAAGLAVLLPVWGVCATALAHAVPGGADVLPLMDLAAEGGTLTLVCYAFILLGLRLSAGVTGSVLAAPGLIILVVVLVSLPDTATFYADPAGPGWEAAVRRWRWLALAALAACALQIGRGWSSGLRRPIATRARTASARE
ncbi:hypothetical protein ACFVT5_37370 [Streptomyces sp. NPDC058001]|uniref:hypothetical protein n=1 Tax=Streptomyces sp. NPDC058001 TaxID=3346300 RepID=UPI0036E5293F